MSFRQMAARVSGIPQAVEGAFRQYLDETEREGLTADPRSFKDFLEAKGVTADHPEWSNLGFRPRSDLGLEFGWHDLVDLVDGEYGVYQVGRYDYDVTKY